MWEAPGRVESYLMALRSDVREVPFRVWGEKVSDVPLDAYKLVRKPAERPVGDGGDPSLSSQDGEGDKEKSPEDLGPQPPKPLTKQDLANLAKAESMHRLGMIPRAG